MTAMLPTPIYSCVLCGRAVWWRLPPFGAWQCSSCRPWWADTVIVAAIDELPIAGARPHAAFADAGAVAAENAELCASRARFLASVAGAGAGAGER
jgi:hypothetical protein